MADAYDRWLAVPVMHPYATELAARVARRKPARVLELAAGTGALTMAAGDAMPSTALIATDFSEAMIEVGRARAPGAAWRVADATSLPFDDSEFDVVMSQFGVMFFPDKRAA